MRRLCLLCILLFCVLTPAAAQDNQIGYPLPKLAVISPENASMLGEKASLGGNLPGDLAWSPDGKTLAVGTTDGVRAYDSSNWDAPPMEFPGWKDVRFNDAGNLISDGNVIDLNSGDILSEASVHKTTPSGKTRIEYGTVNSHAAVILTDLTTHIMTLLDTGLSGTINRVVFSPSERRAGIEMTSTSADPYTRDEVVQLWNAITGTLVKTLDTTGMYPDYFIDTFGFHDGGKMLILSSRYDGEDGSTAFIQMWNSQSGEALNPDAGNAMLPLVFSPDDRFMAFPGGGGITLWSDHKIGVLKNETGYLTPVFSPNGNMLVGYGSDVIKVWQLNTALNLGQPEKTFPLDGQIVMSVTFSPNSKLLADAEYHPDRRIRVWNLETGHVESVIQDVAGKPQFSPNSQWLLEQRTVMDRQYSLWDVHTGEKLIDFQPNFAISPDWTVAAQPRNLTAVEIIALPTGHPLGYFNIINNYLGKISLFDAGVGRVLFGPDAFNLSTGRIVMDTNYEPSTKFKFNADWTRVLTLRPTEPSSITFVPNIFTLVEGLEPDSHIPDTIGPGGILTSDTTAFLTPDGKTIGYITNFGPYSDDNRLEFRDVRNGEHLAEWMIPGDVETMTASHDGKWLVFGTTIQGEGRLIFLDLTENLSTATPIVRTINPPVYGDGTKLTSLTFSTDDSHIAVDGYRFICGDGCINDYFVKSWAVEPLLAGDTPDEQSSTGIVDVHAPILSADGRWLAVTEGGSERVLTTGALQFWDTAANKKVVELPVSDGLAAFSPDGRLLAVHQTHQTMIYDATDLRRGVIRILAACPDRDTPVTEVAFSPDGTILYVVSENRVRLFGVRG